MFGDAFDVLIRVVQGGLQSLSRARGPRSEGIQSLGGMQPRSGLVVRPFLDARRAAVRALLTERGARFCEDPTNADVAIPRNRIRHELLPLLERRFSPAIVDVLNREAAIARELGVAYVGIAVVANRAAGLENNPLTMDAIMATLGEAMDRVKSLISEFVSADDYSDSGKA